MYKERVEPVLVLLLDSYSEDKKISICDSGSFSSSTYTITDYLSTSYCPKEKICDVVLRKMFYSKQFLKNDCCSSA